MSHQFVLRHSVRIGDVGTPFLQQPYGVYSLVDEPEELLENLSVPGPEEGNSPEEFEGWTSGLLHRAIEQIASWADREGPEAVLEAAMRSAEWKVKKAKQTA